MTLLRTGTAAATACRCAGFVGHWTRVTLGESVQVLLPAADEEIVTHLTVAVGEVDRIEALLAAPPAPNDALRALLRGDDASSASPDGGR